MSGVVGLGTWLLIVALLAAWPLPWPRVRALTWLFGAALLWLGLSLWPPEGLVIIAGVPVALYKPIQLGPFTFQVDMSAHLLLRWLALGLATWSLFALLSPSWEENLEWAILPALAFLMASTGQELWAVGIWWATWALASLVTVFAGKAAPGRATWQWTSPFLMGALLQTSLLMWPDPNQQGPEAWRLWVVAVTLFLFSSFAPVHLGYVSLGVGGTVTGAVFTWLLHPLLVLDLVWRVGGDPRLYQALELSWRLAEVLVPVTLIWIGLRGLTSRDVYHLSGLAVAFNWVLTWVLWLTSPQNSTLVGVTLAIRWLSLTAMAAGLRGLTVSETGEAPPGFSGLGYRRPWATAAWVLGVASLMGLPFTAGSWLVWTAHAVEEALPGGIWWPLGAAFGLAAGLASTLVRFWEGSSLLRLPREDWGGRIVAVVSGLPVIWLGLWPQWLVALSRWLY